MVCCVVLLVFPITCLKDDKKEPVRMKADWMELVAQRRSLDGIIRVHGIRSPTASSKLPNNKYTFETKTNQQSLCVDRVNVW